MPPCRIALVLALALLGPAFGAAGPGAEAAGVDGNRAFGGYGEVDNRARWGAAERAVAQADEEFFARSSREGAAAWEAFAAPDAVLPRRQVAVGPKAIREAQEALYARPGFQLLWYPTYARVMGELAVTGGPYELRLRDASDTEAVSHGTYVTLWRRQPDGAWKFVYDTGTPAAERRPAVPPAPTPAP